MIKISKSNQKYNMELVVAAFQENYQQILDFLTLDEHPTLKLSNCTFRQFAEESTISLSPLIYGRDLDQKYQTAKWNFSKISTLLKNNPNPSANRKNKSGYTPSKRTPLESDSEKPVMSKTKRQLLIQSITNSLSGPQKQGSKDL